MGTKLTVIDVIIGIIGFAGTIGGVVSFFRYGDYIATVKLQNDSIAALEKNNEILTKAVEDTKKTHLAYVEEVKKTNLEHAKEIGILEGQIKLYKDLQLEKMANAMEDISRTNELILGALKGNSSTGQHKAGLLVHTDEPVTIKQEKGVQ